MMPIRLFCSDLDGTLLGHAESTRAFKRAWESLPGTSRPLLSYASGRLLPDIQEVLASGMLPQPDYIIGGVGIQIYDVRRDLMLPKLSETKVAGWERSRVESVVASFPDISPQPTAFQHPYKSSWYWYDASSAHLDELRKKLSDAGLLVTVIYSSHRDVDILPQGTNKGAALCWLCTKLHLSTGEVLVAGDTGNDLAMFRLPGVRGILVGNARVELIESLEQGSHFMAKHPMAEGVMDGLRHFGVLLW